MKPQCLTFLLACLPYLAEAALFSSILPGSRSTVPGQEISAFLSAINAGAERLEGCRVTNPHPDIVFRYQLYDRQTGSLVPGTDPVFAVLPAEPGMAPPPVDLVFFAAPGREMPPRALGFPVSCADGTETPEYEDINTLTLGSFASQPADIIAIASTTAGNGIVDLDGRTGEGLFRVAAVNIGSRAEILVRTEAGGAESLLCFNNISGECISERSASLDWTAGNGATQTFNVYIQSDETVTLDPAVNRVRVIFEANGNSHGGTSVSFRTGETSAPPDQEALFRVTFIAQWSATRHPGAFPLPSQRPHFTILFGALHNSDYVLYEIGGLASRGLESVAEVGGTSILRSEVTDEISAGRADTIVQFGGINAGEGRASIRISANLDFPLLSLATMVAPSPDWFVGLSSQSLLDESGDWIQHMEIPVHPLDAGTEEGSRFSLNNPASSPHEPISLLTRAPFAASRNYPPIATFLIERVN